MNDYRGQVAKLVERCARLVSNRDLLETLELRTLSIQVEGLAERAERCPDFAMGMAKIRPLPEWMSAFEAVLDAFEAQEPNWPELAEDLTCELTKISCAWNYTVFTPEKAENHRKLMGHSLTEAASFKALWESLEVGTNS